MSVDGGGELVGEALEEIGEAVWHHMEFARDVDRLIPELQSLLFSFEEPWVVNIHQFCVPKYGQERFVVHA